MNRLPHDFYTAIAVALVAIAITSPLLGDEPDATLLERLLKSGATITEISNRWKLGPKESLLELSGVKSEITEIKYHVFPKEIEYIEGLDLITWPKGPWRELSREELNAYSFNDTDAIACGKLKSVHSLLIPLTDVTDQFLKEYESLNILKTLDLSFNKITDKGVANLERATNLKELWLANTEITDECAKHISALKKLEFLDISHTAFSDKFVDAILQMKQLKHVNFTRSNFTSEVADRLRAKKPPRKPLSLEEELGP